MPAALNVKTKCVSRMQHRGVHAYATGSMLMLIDSAAAVYCRRGPHHALNHMAVGSRFSLVAVSMRNGPQAL